MRNGAMMKLYLRKRGKPLGELDLSDGVTTIGRRPDNDIVLSDRAVSGRHARIELTGGEVTIQDLDSTNGTFVNGRRVTTHSLRDGDMIAIGNYRLGFGRGEVVVQDPGPPTQILRVDRPGMPPGLADEHCTRRIRQLRAAARQAGQAADRQMALRIMSGCNQGRQLDLLGPVTALGEPGQEVVVFLRSGDELSIRQVQGDPGRVRVNDVALEAEAVPLRHNDVIHVGDLRILIVVGPDPTDAHTGLWTLE